MADTLRGVLWTLQPVMNTAATPVSAPASALQSGRLHWQVNPVLEAFLWQAIVKAGMEARLRAAFHVTDPLWFGFWMDSPLTREQCEILYEVFSWLHIKRKQEREAYESFLNALQSASRGEAEFHVTLEPPGHTDFGIHTIFPHCPRCKALAPVPLWEMPPAEPLACPLCGQVYSPAATCSSRAMPRETEETIPSDAWQVKPKREWLSRFVRHLTVVFFIIIFPLMILCFIFGGIYHLSRSLILHRFISADAEDYMWRKICLKRHR